MISLFRKDVYDRITRLKDNLVNVVLDQDINASVKTAGMIAGLYESLTVLTDLENKLKEEETDDLSTHGPRHRK